MSLSVVANNSKESSPDDEIGSIYRLNLEDQDLQPCDEMQLWLQRSMQSDSNGVKESKLHTVSQPLLRASIPTEPVPL